MSSGTATAAFAALFAQLPTDQLAESLSKMSASDMQAILQLLPPDKIRAVLTRPAAPLEAVEKKGEEKKSALFNDQALWESEMKSRPTSGSCVLQFGLDPVLRSNLSKPDTRPISMYGHHVSGGLNCGASGASAPRYLVPKYVEIKFAPRTIGASITFAGAQGQAPRFVIALVRSTDDPNTVQFQRCTPAMHSTTYTWASVQQECLSTIIIRPMDDNDPVAITHCQSYQSAATSTGAEPLSASAPSDPDAAPGSLRGPAVALVETRFGSDLTTWESEMKRRASGGASKLVFGVHMGMFSLSAPDSKPLEQFGHTVTGGLNAPSMLPNPAMYLCQRGAQIKITFPPRTIGCAVDIARPPGVSQNPVFSASVMTGGRLSVAHLIRAAAHSTTLTWTGRDPVSELYLSADHMDIALFGCQSYCG